MAGAEDLASGSLMPAMPGGVRLVVGRRGDAFFALDGICPHAGAILAEGLLDDDLLICPVHAFAFEVETGRCVDDASCSVRRYETRVHDGAVQVRLGAAVRGSR